MISESKALFNKHYYKTIFIIAKNHITRRYQGSYLGVLWTLLAPTAQIAIYSFVMPRIMKFPAENYVPFIISSLLVWIFINNVILASAAALQDNASTITRCLVSKTIFPLADFIHQLYTSFVAIILGYIFSCFAYGTFSIKILLLPFYFGLVLMALAPITIAISFITVYIKDFKELLAIIMSFAFWATPVVYPIEMFPEDKRFIFFFNPFYIMIKPISGLLYKGEIPSDMDTLRLFVLIVISVTVSYFIYRKLRRNFIFYL